MFQPFLTHTWMALSNSNHCALILPRFLTIFCSTIRYKYESYLQDVTVTRGLTLIIPKCPPQQWVLEPAMDEEDAFYFCINDVVDKAANSAFICGEVAELDSLPPLQIVHLLQRQPLGH